MISQIFNSTINSPSPADKTMGSDQQHMQLLKQIDILSFESDEEILNDNADDDQEAFNSLTNLMLPINITQLSVFVNFTFIHSISEPILFYLITDLYKKGNLKDMKKWAYEIFSSFIALSAVSKFFLIAH
jgi:hypothetical protein